MVTRRWAAAARRRRRLSPRRAAGLEAAKLLQLGLGARFLKLFLDILGLRLGDAFLDRRGRTIHQAPWHPSGQDR